MKTAWYALIAVSGVINVTAFIVGHPDMWWSAIGLFAAGVCIQQFLDHLCES